MELRAGMGEWVFGCDLCQDVCPWNRKSPESPQPDFAPRDDTNPLELTALFELDDDSFRERFRATPLWRPKRRGILRNAAIALGNNPTSSALPALVRGLNDHEPLVRGASAWALGRYGAEGRAALLARQALESDAEVLEEITGALVEFAAGPLTGEEGVGE
jgi:epoxyqueuosine reductase